MQPALKVPASSLAAPCAPSPKLLAFARLGQVLRPDNPANVVHANFKGLKAVPPESIAAKVAKVMRSSDHTVNVDRA